MFKYRKKIDEKIAGRVVKYLIQTSITPNQVTTFSLLLAAFAAVFFSFGIYFFSVIGSLLFILLTSINKSAKESSLISLHL